MLQHIFHLTVHIVMYQVCILYIVCVKYTWDPPHFLESTTAQPVQNTVCGSSSLLVLLMMGIMMPETC
jgi:hypothetical protein